LKEEKSQVVMKEISLKELGDFGVVEEVTIIVVKKESTIRSRH